MYVVWPNHVGRVPGAVRPGGRIKSRRPRHPAAAGMLPDLALVESLDLLTITPEIACDRET